MIGPLRCKGFLRGWGQRLERFARRALPAGAAAARDATSDDSQFTKTLWQALDKIEGGEALGLQAAIFGLRGNARDIWRNLAFPTLTKERRTVLGRYAAGCASEQKSIGQSTP